MWSIHSSPYLAYNNGLFTFSAIKMAVQYIYSYSALVKLKHWNNTRVDIRYFSSRLDSTWLSPVLSRNIKCAETENYIHFWVEHCQKYGLFQKKLQIKVIWHLILDKKVFKGICLSSSGMEQGASKDDMVEKSECIFPFL